MTMGAGFIPKPDDGWPTWAVVVYYIVMTIIGLGVVAVMIIKTFKFLKKGQAGIRVRRGRPVIKNGEYAYVGPGIHPMVPFVDSIEEISVLGTTTDLPVFLAERGNAEQRNCQYVIDAKPTWYVIDTPQGVHDAIFTQKNLEESVTAQFCKALNRAVESAEDPTRKDQVEADALSACEANLRKIGVKVSDMGLISVTKVPVQVLGELLNPEGVSKNADVGQTGGAAAAALGLLQGGQSA
jgi:regulator of protease activity HflC (stomatin/prohibitin superfamily)